jgi:hypothetical protein
VSGTDAVWCEQCPKSRRTARESFSPAFDAAGTTAPVAAGTAAGGPAESAVGGSDSGNIIQFVRTNGGAFLGVD